MNSSRWFGGKVRAEISQWFRGYGALLFVLTILLQGMVIALSYAAAVELVESEWRSLINVKEFESLLTRPNIVVVDVRSAEDYQRGHIPGAINLPGALWRTPATKPEDKRPGQQVFRTADGQVDVAKYERLLSDAGIRNDHEVVIYGNHAGKADGSVPAALLIKLGHKKVAFLDGVGLEEWKNAGHSVTATPHRLPASEYRAEPQLDRFWSREDVLSHLGDDQVVIVDSRTPQEYSGQDLRGNQRGGHIPGALLLNSEELLDPKTHRTIGLDLARSKLEKVLPKDKTIVIYCQSGTRCSHKELLLRDLGYKNVVLYDASWQDWGNRSDTPIESAASPAEKEKDKEATAPAK